MSSDIFRRKVDKRRRHDQNTFSTTLYFALLQPLRWSQNYWV